MVEDTFWTPRIIVILTIAVVFGFCAVFSIFALRGYAPLQFHCRRCDRGFRRAPYRRMPLRCPHCKTTNWTL